MRAGAGVGLSTGVVVFVIVTPLLPSSSSSNVELVFVFLKEMIFCYSLPKKQSIFQPLCADHLISHQDWFSISQPFLGLWGLSTHKRVEKLENVGGLAIL